MSNHNTDSQYGQFEPGFQHQPASGDRPQQHGRHSGDARQSFEALSAWLDDQLVALETRFASFTTPRSIRGYYSR